MLCYGRLHRQKLEKERNGDYEQKKQIIKTNRNLYHKQNSETCDPQALMT